MTDSRRVSYFYDAEVGNYHYGQGTLNFLKIDERVAKESIDGLCRKSTPTTVPEAQ